MPVVAVVKWGNSLAVRIPKAVAEDAGLREGDALTIEAGLGQIELLRTERIPTLKDLVARITPENRYDEMPSGAEWVKEAGEW
ncbi:MAG TPA: AbrB/MazE/SpoVT family DNA-binding domain-containing protein [Terriglobales bacterium]|nr:AbrB/MazE/SpoVT family DNA-binding domain-containing protein [Terriglobales bacterium]